MSRGIVKSVTDKGYGFIKTPDSQDKDIFYHELKLTGELSIRKLRVDDEVEFTIARNEKGLNAENIRLVEAEDASDESTDIVDSKMAEDDSDQDDSNDDMQKAA